MQQANQAVFSFSEVKVLQDKPQLTPGLISDFATSAKTSIFRAGPSAPIKILVDKGLFTQGSAINYGKGRHNHDTNAIKEITGHCVGYDYVHLPDTDLLGSSYSCLFSGYVVNTLPILARAYVWNQMAQCTKNDGVAFVAARTDKIKGTPSEDGVITSIGTFQKSYAPQALKIEAQDYFKYVVEIKGKAGFSIVACSNSPLSEHILNHAK